MTSRAESPGGGQRQEDHQQDRKRVVADVIAVGESQSEQHRNAEQGKERKVGQDGLQQLGDKNRPNGHRRCKQKVHIARKIQGLQQNAEAGQQCPDEQRGQCQCRDGCQDAAQVNAGILRELRRMHEPQQPAARGEQEVGKRQQQQPDDNDADLFPEFGVTETVIGDPQAQAQQLPD